MSKPDAVIWKHGPVVDFRADEIIAWRHPTLPQPSPAEIDQAFTEYQAMKAAKTPDDVATEKLTASRELRVMVRALVALTGKTIAECRAAIIAAIKLET